MSKKNNKNFDEKAEKILNDLNQEEHAEENKKDKKESKKENKQDKKESKKENKKDKKQSKKENKKGKKQSKKENKKDNSKWLKDNTKFSNKVIKITSPIWMMQFNIMGENHNYQLIHKKTKKENIKIRIQNDTVDFTIKCKKADNDFDFEVSKVINKNGVETLVKYDLDYFEEYGDIIPFKILISPVVDFYYNLHTSLLTEGNTKVRDNSIIIDANIRKDGYQIEPKDLAIEELDELNRDYDNRLGASIEYFRRYTLLNICDKKPEASEETKNEQIKLESPKVEQPKRENELVKVQNNKPVKTEKPKTEKPKTEKPKTTPIRKQIVEKTKVRPKEKTPQEKIIHYVAYNDDAIDKSLCKCTNVAERARAFMGHLIDKLVPEVTVGDIITYLAMNNAWTFYVFNSRNVVDIRKNMMVEFMVSQISLVS